MFLACDDVCVSVENTLTELNCLPFSSRGTDIYLTNLGLESTTSLTAYISQEGLLSWIKQKLFKIGRKITIAVNKIYSKLTKADDDIKKLIEQASKDDTIELPISGKKLAVIASVAAAAATVITVTCASIMSGKKEDKDKSDSLFLKFKEVANKTKEENSKDKEEKVKSSLFKSYLNKIRKTISSIINGIKSFHAGMKKGTEEVAKTAEKQDHTNDNKGILSRFKGIGESIKRIFSTVAKFVKICVLKHRWKDYDPYLLEYCKRYKLSGAMYNILQLGAREKCKNYNLHGQELMKHIETIPVKNIRALIITEIITYHGLTIADLQWIEKKYPDLYEPHKDIDASKFNNFMIKDINSLYGKMMLDRKLCLMNFTKDRLILLARSAEKYKSHK